MAQRYEITLPFPLAGLDRSMAFSRQAPMTTPDCLNVRPDGQGSYRQRGGSRPGLGPEFRTNLGGPVRMITKVAVYRPEYEYEINGYKQTQLRDVLEKPNWGAAPLYQGGSSFQGSVSGLYGTQWAAQQVTQPVVDTSQVNELSVLLSPYDPTFTNPTPAYNGIAHIYFGALSRGDDPTENGWDCELILQDGKYQIVLTKYVAGVVNFQDTSPQYSDNPNVSGTFAIRLNYDTGDITTYWRNQFMSGLNGQSIAGRFVATGASDPSIAVREFRNEFHNPTGTMKVDLTQRRDVIVASALGKLWVESTTNELTEVASSFTLTDDKELMATDREQLLYIADYGTSVSGTTASILPGYGTLQDNSKDFVADGITTDYSLQINSAESFFIDETQLLTLTDVDDGSFTLTFYGQTTASIPWNATFAEIQQKLEDLSNLDVGEVNVIDGTGTSFEIKFTGTRYGKQPLELMTANGTLLINTDVPAKNPQVTINSLYVGTGPEGIAGTYAITVVTANTLSFSPAALTGDQFQAWVAQQGSPLALGNVSYGVGRPPKIYDPKTNMISIHTADENKGFVPTACRLVTLYRDRIMYAGSDELPHVWFMSRQGDPNDWDYSQTDSGAAVFAQASIAGNLADPITALIVHGDDCVIIGCYNSLWILRGDPGFGGVMDQLSLKIGIVGPRAWCKTPDDQTVIMSADGLYVMASGCHGFPVSLSRERLPDELTSLSSEREIIRLEFDVLARGIHIYVTRYDSSEATHFFFDWEAKSFWRISLPTNTEPFSTHERTVWDNASTVLHGGRDGFIRSYDRLLEVDDGDFEIESYVLLGPVFLTKSGYHEGVVSELTADLGANSGSMRWDLHVGESAQEAYDAPSRENGIWNRDKLNYTSRPRARGVSAVVRISNDGKQRWMFERVTSVIKKAGRRSIG